MRLSYSTCAVVIVGLPPALYSNGHNNSNTNPLYLLYDSSVVENYIDFAFSDLLFTRLDRGARKSSKDSEWARGFELGIPYATYAIPTEDIVEEYYRIRIYSLDDDVRLFTPK